MQPIFDYGGDGPLLLLSTATGIVPQTYSPMMQALAPRYHAQALLQRALWPDEPLPQTLMSWKETVAQDIVASLRERELEGVIGLGHSMGGVAMLLAAIAEPKRFRALIMMDPVILARRYMWPLWLHQKFNLFSDHPLALRAEKRRDRFDSRDAAFEYFSSKRFFADWPEKTIRLYANSMVDHPEGGVTLWWPRAWEAYYFRSVYTGTWGEISHLQATGLPVLLIRGATSDTLSARVATRLQRLLPEMAYRELSGHGHLFPQSAPIETAQTINNWLSRL